MNLINDKDLAKNRIKTDIGCLRAFIAGALEEDKVVKSELYLEDLNDHIDDLITYYERGGR
jgi:hypothetical protein